MYPYLRMGLALLRARRVPGKTPPRNGCHAIHRAWPWDTDMYGELNNGRILTLMELGRWELAVESGLLREMRRRRAAFAVAGGPRCDTGAAFPSSRATASRPGHWAGTRGSSTSTSRCGWATWRRTRCSCAPRSWAATARYPPARSPPRSGMKDLRPSFRTGYGTGWRLRRRDPGRRNRSTGRCPEDRLGVLFQRCRGNRT